MTSKANQSQGMLLFHLSAKQSFAIGTLKVKEIVPYTQLTAMPHSHPTVQDHRVQLARYRIAPCLPRSQCVRNRRDPGQ